MLLKKDWDTHQLQQQLILILICTQVNRKHWIINLMIYFKIEKIGNSTENREKRQGPITLVVTRIPAAGAEPARPRGYWIRNPVQGFCFCFFKEKEVDTIHARAMVL